MGLGDKVCGVHVFGRLRVVDGFPVVFLLNRVFLVIVLAIEGAQVRSLNLILLCLHLEIKDHC